MSEMVPLIPFSEILKLVISQAKKVKAFKPLFKDLASTMERLLAIFQEIDSLQEKLDPGNGELNFLIKTMLRAKKMVRKCSRVRAYSLGKINSYTADIEGINKDLVKFCQVDLPLIQHRNQLRSRLNMNESPPRLEANSDISTRAPLLDEDENVKRVSLREAEAQNDQQFASAIRESSSLVRQREEEEEIKRIRVLKEEISLREAEELALAIQESSFFRQREEEEERKRARALKEEISLREAEQLASAIQESSLFRQREEEEERKRARALKEEISLREAEELASAIQESYLLCQREDEEERKRTRALKEENSLREAEELASAIQEESYLVRHKEEEEERKRTRALNDEKIANGSFSSTRAHEDEQRVIWESIKEKGKGNKVKVDEEIVVALQESLNMKESPPRVEANSSISTRASLDEAVEQRAILESLKEKGKGKQVKVDEQLAVALQESLNKKESRPPRCKANSNISTRAPPLDEDEQRALWESFKEKGKRKAS